MFERSAQLQLTAAYAEKLLLSAGNILGPPYMKSEALLDPQACKLVGLLATAAFPTIALCVPILQAAAPHGLVVCRSVCRISSFLPCTEKSPILCCPIANIWFIVDVNGRGTSFHYAPATCIHIQELGQVIPAAILIECAGTCLCLSRVRQECMLQDKLYIWSILQAEDF